MHKLMFSAKIKQRNQRTVPGFTVQSMQKNTKVCRPPYAGCQRERLPKTTIFRKFYQRGDFPLMVEHGSRGNKISWKADLQKLDYHYYLPLFVDGLCETTYPYCFLAKQGIYDLLEQGGSKVLPVLPQLIAPIRSALNTRNHQIVNTTLRVLQKMVTCVEGFGESLVPYYRQILPILNLFKNHNLNSGDAIDYGQKKKEILGDLIQETLEILEMHGGEDAYYHLKYMIPTYESCLNKSLRVEFQ